MIGYLRGIMRECAERTMLLDVQGVGYEVIVPDTVRALFDVGNQLELYIYTHVREDQLSLFGFLTKEAKQLFLLLTSVSGIGPKIGIDLLGVGESALISAIAMQDMAFLTSCPGIGKKTAERLTLELKEKITQVQVSAEPTSATGYTSTKMIEENYADILLALEGLGYEKKHVLPVLSQCKEEFAGVNVADEVILTYCLRHL